MVTATGQIYLRGDNGGLVNPLKIRGDKAHKKAMKRKKQNDREIMAQFQAERDRQGVEV